MISLLFSASPTTPAPLRRSEPPAESASVNQEAGAVKHTSSSSNNNNNRLQQQVSSRSWTNKRVRLGKKTKKNFAIQAAESRWASVVVSCWAVLYSSNYTSRRWWWLHAALRQKEKEFAWQVINNTFMVPGMVFMLIGGIILHACIDSDWFKHIIARRNYKQSLTIRWGIPGSDLSPGFPKFLLCGFRTARHQDLCAWGRSCNGVL